MGLDVISVPTKSTSRLLVFLSTSGVTGYFSKNHLFEGQRWAAMTGTFPVMQQSAGLDL